MINVETLRKGPPQQEKAPLPIFTDDQAKSALVNLLEAARARTEQIVGLAESPSARREIYSIFIFSMSAEEPLSTIYDGRDKEVGLCERGKLQNIAFEVMGRYGLNPNVSQPYYDSSSWGHNGISEHSDGTSREILKFPSQTVAGLDFVRWRDFYTETGETIYVSWFAEAHKKPFRAHFGKLIPKNPQVVEI